jgi:8-oxo-dGTP diphosphatase
MEETGLTIAVGPPALVNEFHDPETGFHQIDLFFRCTIAGGTLDADWTDPEGVVTDRRFFTRARNSPLGPSASSPTACPPSLG